MRLTATILFLSILVTLESLVGAVAIHNREVYKRAPRAEYEIDAYRDIYCANRFTHPITLHRNLRLEFSRIRTEVENVVSKVAAVLIFDVLYIEYGLNIRG
ncbi:hypothetical protein LENED_005933 [Lentinula edodes]|uniref:Uncharacterized protein n=1 Tax=Lentinula edodes TaxID=5353 RepID=A0A1Q3EAJ4_LENED|nr:hypothetical protein LENED_005933 [Lentinula edodes]